MDISGLLSTLKWIGAIFPIFNIEFPFHIAYDIIIRLASSWILEDSVDEIAGFFNSAFGSAIQYMYDLDQQFLKMCLDMWSSTIKFALALLPLMLLLSIFSTVKYGGERSALTLVKTRELAFGNILNVGLAASSYGSMKIPAAARFFREKCSKYRGLFSYFSLLLKTEILPGAEFLKLLKKFPDCFCNSPLFIGTYHISKASFHFRMCI